MPTGCNKFPIDCLRVTFLSLLEICYFYVCVCLFPSLFNYQVLLIDSARKVLILPLEYSLLREKRKGLYSGLTTAARFSPSVVSVLATKLINVCQHLLQQFPLDPSETNFVDTIFLIGLAPK